MEIIQINDLERSRKNDFSFSFKNGKETVFFLPYVQTPYKALKWFKIKINKEITHINIYERRTREYLGTVKINLNSIY